MSDETPAPQRGFLRSALRDPLFHFIVAGGVMFAALSSVEAGKLRVIRISGAEVGQLVGFWKSQTGRAPAKSDLDALVEERVNEEVLAREAIRLGLDRDDIIIRRRLAQKMAFAGEDMTRIADPSESDMRAYFERHRSSYVLPPVYSLRHIYFSRDRRGVSAAAAASAALRQLSRPGARATAGDPFMLPLEMADVRPEDLRKDLGDSFAVAVTRAVPGRWTGPVESPYGVHIVRVEAHRASRAPTFEDVRPQVHDALLAERQAAANAAYRKTLRDRYRIEVAPPDMPPPEVAGTE